VHEFYRIQLFSVAVTILVLSKLAYFDREFQNTTMAIVIVRLLCCWEC